MALVKNIDHQPMERDSAHSEVECTYDVVVDKEGGRCLQLDTYGSKERQIKGKKSQSIRLTPEGIRQLKEILTKHDL